MIGAGVVVLRAGRLDVRVGASRRKLGEETM